MQILKKVTQYAQYLKKNKDLKFPSASVLAGIKSPQYEKGSVTNRSFRYLIADGQE